jgi:hypothetical protein
MRWVTFAECNCPERKREERARKAEAAKKEEERLEKQRKELEAQFKIQNKKEQFKAAKIKAAQEQIMQEYLKTQEESFQRRTKAVRHRNGPRPFGKPGEIDTLNSSLGDSEGSLSGEGDLAARQSSLTAFLRRLKEMEQASTLKKEQTLERLAQIKATITQDYSAPTLAPPPVRIPRTLLRLMLPSSRTKEKEKEKEKEEEEEMAGKESESRLGSPGLLQYSRFVHSINQEKNKLMASFS